MLNCLNKPAFRCNCKTPSVLVCDGHFSIHIKTKGLVHQYEFISVAPVQNSVKSPTFKDRVKNLEVYKLLENLPAATKQTLFKFQNEDYTIKLPNQFIPQQEEVNKHFYSEKEFYEGEWSNNKEHGRGKFTGLSEYEGEWKNGLPDGSGVFTFNSGKYSGNWYQGHMNGEGTLELNNGDKYVGEFKESKFQGNGVYTFADNTQVKGHFKDHFLITADYYSSMPYNYVLGIEALKTKKDTPERFAILSQVFSTYLSEIRDVNSSMDCIRFFKNNSLIMVKISLEDCEKTDENMNSPHKFSYLAGICEIQGLLFHVGGLLGEKSTGNSLVFNPSNSAVTWMESCKRRSSPCAINIGTKIYVFGGSDQFLSFLSTCEVYNFLDHKWSEFTSLPQSSDGMSAGVLGNYILLSGYLHTKAYIYDTLASQYLDVLELPDFKEKVFCTGLGMAYVLCNKKLYESKQGKPFKWKAVRDIVYYSGWCIGNPIKKGKLLYWYTTDKELWKFDLDTKGVFLLKKFK